MAELVNDYQAIPENNEEGSTETEGTGSKPSRKTSSDLKKSDDTRLKSQQIHNHELISKIDNSSFEQMLEKELFNANYDPASWGAANDVGGNDLPSKMAKDDPKEKETSKIETAYIDLLKKVRQRENAAPVGEELDHHLVGVLAKNLNGREQSAVPGAEDNLKKDYYQEQFAHLYQKQNMRKNGFWTWRKTLSSALMLGVVASLGYVVKTQGLPGALEEITKVAQAASLIAPQSTTAAPNRTAGAALPGSSEAISVVEFINEPAQPGVNVQANRQNGGVGQRQLSALDNKPEIKQVNSIDNLNAKLKEVSAYQRSLQLAYNIANPEIMPKLLEEITKTQREITSLEQEIAVFAIPPKIFEQPAGQGKTEITLAAKPKSAVTDNLIETTSETILPETSIAKTIITEPKVTEARITEARVTEPRVTEPEVSLKKVAIAAPLPPAKVSKARDPKAVELAMASTPGLYRLEQTRRDQLKAKLVNGDCLVPALSSVFPQVPVLVMRDMVRQLNNQC